MSPQRQRSPKTILRRVLGRTLAPSAAALLALCGCSDTGDRAPQAVALSVELGTTFSADELVASTPLGPSVIAPTPAPQEPTSGTDGRETPTAPTPAIPANPAPQGGFASWPNEPLPSPSYVAPYREPVVARSASPTSTPEPYQPPRITGARPDFTSGPSYQEPTKLRLDVSANETAPEETLADNDLDATWEDAWDSWPEDDDWVADLEQAEAEEADADNADPTPTVSKDEPTQAKAEPALNSPKATESPIATRPTVTPPQPITPPTPYTVQLFNAPVNTPPIGPPPVSITPDPSDPLADETLFTETPAVSEISRLMLEPVRDAFALGRSGAVFAAQAKFEETLRKIANAKDAAAGHDEHLRALVDGLRALDEAQHFLPQGDALDEGLDVASIARGHRTPVLHHAAANRMLPQQAIARYHLHAARRLAAAVRGEQAGSMALFGLGKAYSRLDAMSEDPLAARRSLAMYRAAILAHDGNHLAANELGVGLAKAGHYAAAGRALDRAASRGGGSTVYRNLAAVQQRLGRPQLALAASTRAEQLAAHERSTGEFSRQLGVRWMTPQQFNRTAADAPTPPVAAPPALAAAPAQPPRQSVAAAPRGPWRRGFFTPSTTPAGPAVGPQVAPPSTALPYRSQTITR